MTDKIVFFKIFKGKALNGDLCIRHARESILTPCNPHHEFSLRFSYSTISNDGATKYTCLKCRIKIKSKIKIFKEIGTPVGVSNVENKCIFSAEK